MAESDLVTYISFYLSRGEMFVYHSAIEALGTPKCVQFKVHVDGPSMLMEPSDKKTFTSFRVPKLKNPDGVGRVRIYSKAFTHILAARQQWDTARSYRIPGKLLPGQKIAVFDLTQAEDITIEQ